MRRRYVVPGVILAVLAAATVAGLLVMTPDAPEHPGTDSCGYSATPSAGSDGAADETG